MFNLSKKDEVNLLSILDSISKIEIYTQDISNEDELFGDTESFDAVLMNFIVIGEMVVRLSDEFTNHYNSIDWFKIKGFRNIVAHDYFGVDAKEVWNIIQLHLPKLKTDIGIIIQHNC
ncbi:MAG: DUF86 domain-containing protein [Chitinophagales bacterium]|nr:DUF86 domain-containing protein [Saprospirales bacterium]MBP6659870.1 DUF86 domain-containing protein [Chitinophagales bacterium]